MTRARQRYQFEPATMTHAEVAEYAFRRGESWFRQALLATDSEVKDFPQPDKALGLFSKRQVDQWLARRFGEEQDAAPDWDGIIAARTRQIGGARVR